MTQVSTTVDGNPPRRLGVWVDHRLARLVELRGDDVVCSTIPSNIPRKHRSTGGTRMPGRSFVRNAGASADHMAHQRAEKIRIFFDQIIGELGKADEICVLGPGEARIELAARIDGSHSLAKRLKGVFSAEKMTDRQLVAAVKGLFH